MIWDAHPDAVEYHLYRGSLANLSYGSFGACHDVADGVRTDTELAEPTQPPTDAGWIYLVTMEDGSDGEGTLGFATSAERSNFAQCP